MIIVNIIFILGALIGLGLLCSFLIILNEHKDEIWEAIYERINKKDDK